MRRRLHRLVSSNPPAAQRAVRGEPGAMGPCWAPRGAPVPFGACCRVPVGSERGHPEPSPFPAHNPRARMGPFAPFLALTFPTSTQSPLDGCGLAAWLPAGWISAGHCRCFQQEQGKTRRVQQCRSYNQPLQPCLRHRDAPGPGAAAAAAGAAEGPGTKGICAFLCAFLGAGGAGAIDMQMRRGGAPRPHCWEMSTCRVHEARDKRS